MEVGLLGNAVAGWNSTLEGRVVVEHWGRKERDSAGEGVVLRSR